MSTKTAVRGARRGAEFRLEPRAPPIAVLGPVRRHTDDAPEPPCPQIDRRISPRPYCAHGGPQPDIAVVRRPGGLAGAWLPGPQDVVLVVEVADTSLERDRDVKIPRYAAAGIPEAWLVDLVAETIDVYRGPGPDGYRERVTLTRGQTLRPLLLSGVAITADEILG
jgi:Uma2 family endonuclease